MEQSAKVHPSQYYFKKISNYGETSAKLFHFSVLSRVSLRLFPSLSHPMYDVIGVIAGNGVIKGSVTGLDLKFNGISMSTMYYTAVSQI